MNKFLIITLLFSSMLYSVEIPTKHSKVREFGKSIEVNAQVIQLSNAKQSIMSLVSGHIEEYFVKLGAHVEKGDKIALIKSISLSNMTADYISLKKQFISQNRNYKASKKLYDKGMISLQELNSQSIQRDAISAKINALKSALQMMGIDTNSLKKASSSYILYAHSSGKVSALLQPRHSVVTEDTPIISIIKNQAFYIKSFVPLKYASSIKIGQKISVNANGNNISTHVTQILPEVDKKTQRVVVLSSVDKPTDELFVNAYVGATLYFDADKKYVAVEKSALSFFNNEWVVFVPKKDEHDDHKEEAQDDHAKDDGHDDHKEEKKEYEARIIKIVTSDDKYTAVLGLNADEEYVSDKSYFVKSMMLKSSLDEHGH